jgi:hypothetical protein
MSGARSLPLIVQLGLLTAALWLAGASASGQPQGGGGETGSLRAERVRALNHPALRLANRSGAVLRLRLQGASRRDLLVPPHEVVRTLVAAGPYRYDVLLGRKVIRRGKIRLRKGHRYHLELSP